MTGILTRGRIILHIGRNKAGSTTIQEFCAANAPRLEAQNVEYVTFGHLWDSNPNLKGFRRFEELAAYACQRLDRRILVSNEFLFGWPDEYTRDAASALASCDVSLIAYIRGYDSWLISAYAEETKRGMNMRDIDQYLEWMSPRISAWRYLKTWGECFGWDKIYLRDVYRASLHGGDLCKDFAKALNVTLPPWSSGISNASSHWTELELARQLCTQNGAVDWAGMDQAEFEPLAQVMRKLARGVWSPEYLSSSQRRELIDLYNSDLQEIAAAGGPKLQPALPPVERPRNAAPSLAQAPVKFLRDFFERAQAPNFVKAHPAAARRAAELVREMGFMPAPAVTGGLKSLRLRTMILNGTLPTRLKKRAAPTQSP